MGTTRRLPVFEKFIQEVRAVWAELHDTEGRMKRVQVLLEGLVNEPTMKEHCKSWPSTEGHKNLLLYEDPDYQFVVNAVVRTPGRDGRIHDHAHAWTAYGVLDGTERLERYRRVDGGKNEGYALISCRRLRFIPRKAGRRDRLPSSFVPSGSWVRRSKAATMPRRTNTIRAKARLKCRSS
jgi:hypothetical protein